MRADNHEHDEASHDCPREKQRVYENEYGEVIEHWKIALIRRRARRMGFRQDEMADVQQQVVLAMEAFRYDPARANGASEKTALTSLADRQLSTLRRAKLRREQLMAAMESEQHEISDQRTGHGDHREAERAVDLVIDVREVVAQLSAADRSICSALSDGQSINQIARTLGCSWHTAKHRIDGLRQHFEHIGMDGWICG